MSLLEIMQRMWIPRRKGQLIIDTWHGGGCYKKVAADNKESSELAKYRTKISGKEVNYTCQVVSIFQTML